MALRCVFEAKLAMLSVIWMILYQEMLAACFDVQ